MNAKPTDTVSHHGKFKYRAIDAVGKSQTGFIEADSEREAMRLLRGRQLTPTQLVPAQSASVSGGGKIKPSDVLAFTNGLSTLVESRVPIDRALRLLEGITESAAMRELTLELLREIKEGRSLAAAMEGRAHEEGKAFEVVKMALVASVRGYPPQVAVEFARKLLFADVRPTFADLEAHLKRKAKATTE